MEQQQQALRLIGRSLVGLAVSCVLVLQLLLVGLALGGAVSAASASDPFVICYGGGDASHDSDTDRKTNHPLHCLLACAQALGSLTPPLPVAAQLLIAPPASPAPALFRAAAVSIPSRLGAAHPSRGPPEA